MVFLFGSLSPTICVDTGTLSSLLSRIQSHLVHKSTTFRKFPPRWAWEKGLYESYIHLNFNDTVLRRDARIPDNNMFVTSFVLYCILEGERILGPKERIPLSSEDLSEAVSAIIRFRDPSYEPLVPIYRFWQAYERKANGSVFYESLPINLVDLSDGFPDFDEFVSFLCEIFRLEKCVDDLKWLKHFIQIALEALIIPPDLDDTFANFALGALLNTESLQDLVPKNVREQWNLANDEGLDVVVNASVFFSYAPYEDTLDASLVDPRTYLVLHDFVESLSGVKIPSTWMYDVSLSRKTYPYEAMPFIVNNVDASVCSNFLFGASHLLVRKPELLTPELKSLYLDAWKFVEWSIKSQRVFQRPDIALLYYPSRYDFCWFVGRFSFFVNSVVSFPFPEMELVAQEALLILQREVTDFLNGTRKTENGLYFWDGFLGNFGGKVRGEDRLFSTALAMNSLIDGWTKSGSDNCSIGWRVGLPHDVKDWIVGSAAYLEQEILKRDAKLMNAFFSGSGKNLATQPFFFPVRVIFPLTCSFQGNFFQYLNGSTPKFHSFPPEQQDLSFLSPELIEGVLGVVEPSKYASWLDQPWFGMNVSRTNTEYDVFPFWSSPALTYALSFLGLSKLSVLERCG